MSLHTILIINSLVLSFLPALLLGGASIISGANAANPKFGSIVVVVSFWLPFSCILSLIGSWIAYSLGNRIITWIFISVPYISFILLLGAMAVLFSRT